MIRAWMNFFDGFPVWNYSSLRFKFSTFHHRFLILLTIHSNPWYNLKIIIEDRVPNHFFLVNKSLYPSPVSAQQAWICHLWFLMDWRFKCLEISAGVKQPLTSCLLAKTKIFALLSSSCPISLWSSSLVILKRSRSVESTTKMIN